MFKSTNGMILFTNLNLSKINIYIINERGKFRFL